MQDLITQRNNAVNQLQAATSLYRKHLLDAADADHRYRLAFSMAIVAERAEKTPVSIIDNICRGKAEVADARYKRDIAEGEAKATYENIQRLKLEIKLLTDDISNQYNRG